MSPCLSRVPGVLADVAKIFAAEEVSIESVLQRGRAPGENVPLILTTHECREASMTRVRARLEGLVLGLHDFVAHGAAEGRGVHELDARVRGHRHDHDVDHRQAGDHEHHVAMAGIVEIHPRPHVGLAGCDMGACALLPRMIGQGRASELREAISQATFSTAAWYTWLSM